MVLALSLLVLVAGPGCSSPPPVPPDDIRSATAAPAQPAGVGVQLLSGYAALWAEQVADMVANVAGVARAARPLPDRPLPLHPPLPTPGAAADSSGGDLPVPVQAVAPDALSAGDVIQVEVHRHPELSFRLPVSAEPFDFPLIGPVELVGHTPVAIARDIRTRLETDYLQRAQVAVTVEHVAPRVFYVVGAVGQPGAVRLDAHDGLTLVQAIGVVGGLTGVADPGALRLVRQADANGERRVYPVDLEGALVGDLEADIAIEAGDTLIVPQLATVFVVGAVKAPGTVRLRRADRTALRAVAMAGGFLADALPGQVTLFRRLADGSTSTYALPLDAGQDAPLEPGDILQIPARPALP